MHFVLQVKNIKIFLDFSLTSVAPCKVSLINKYRLKVSSINVQHTKIWDIYIRIFHWGLLTAFATSYLTEDDFPTIHVYAGYTMIALIMLRLVWGFIGSRYARFNSFVVRPREVFKYLKDVMKFKAKHYLGHNPAGGAMVITLLISLTLTLLFGLLTFGVNEYSGPLAGMAFSISEPIANIFEDLHELFANFTLFLIVLHVIGVAIASFQHRENLVKSMITGYKKLI